MVLRRSRVRIEIQTPCFATRDQGNRRARRNVGRYARATSLDSAVHQERVRQDLQTWRQLMRSFVSILILNESTHISRQ